MSFSQYTPIAMRNESNSSFYTDGHYFRRISFGNKTSPGLQHRSVPLDYNHVMIDTWSTRWYGGDYNNFLLRYDIGPNPEDYNRDIGLLDQSLMRLYNSLGAQLQTASDIIEARQSVNLVYGALKGFASGLRAIKKGDVKAMFKSFGINKPHLSKQLVRKYRKARKQGVHRDDAFLSDVLLQVQFGWLPLVDTAYQHMLLIDEFLNGTRPILLRARGFARDERPYTSVMMPTYSGRLYWNGKTESVSLWQAQLSIRSEDAWKRNLHDYGLTNPLATIWEIIPFSFVVDMTVLPIASYLKQFDALVGTNLDWVFTSNYANRTATGIYRSKYQTIGQITSISGSYNKHLRTRLNGIPNFSLPIMNVYDTLNFDKITTIAALFDSTFNPKRK